MEKQKVIIWSPSSWALWKQCPAKYRIKQLERWKYSKESEDRTLSKLAIPGLVVDKLLQLWLHRNQFDAINWFDHNFDMVWRLVVHDINPDWNEEESCQTKEETSLGLSNAVTLLQSVEIEKYRRIIQAKFFEPISDNVKITGAADLLLIDELKKEGILIDFKNNHSRQRVTKDQLVIYKIGLEKKFSIDINQAGYLMFNPRLNDWKWFNLKNPAHREKIESNLIEASSLITQKDFRYNWNKFYCTRFCEVRLNCELFQQLTLKQTYRNP